MTPTLERWTAERSTELYGVREWGAGFFGISPSGDLQVTAEPGNFSGAVSIPEILAGIQDRGLDMPVLLRIENILDTQISLLNDSFQAAMESLAFKGSYLGAYPIKVNQQQQVVEARDPSRQKVPPRPGSGQQGGTHLGDGHVARHRGGARVQRLQGRGVHRPRAARHPVGLQVRAGHRDAGRTAPDHRTGPRPWAWTPSWGCASSSPPRPTACGRSQAGDRSIFGLNAAQIIEIIDVLKDAEMLDCLQLLHYHLGSQIPNIREIRNAVAEASRVYAGLVGEGAGMRYLDLGGGLAVDYDGTQTTSCPAATTRWTSTAWTWSKAVMTVLDEQGVTHPTIITESGRALVAYYSMLLFNVLDSARFEPEPLPESLPEGTNIHILHLYETLEGLTPPQHTGKLQRHPLLPRRSQAGVRPRQTVFPRTGRWATTCSGKPSTVSPGWPKTCPRSLRSWRASPRPCPTSTTATSAYSNPCPTHGHRATVPDHAGASLERKAYPRRTAGRHHL